MSKKISIAAVVAMLFVLVVAAGAFAAQNIDPNGYGNKDVDYTTTPKTFTPDGTTNYPYEIYLPNEVDPASYRIHSNYNATTDACASCHATHTAAGEALLQWGTVYDTCMACHDGTVTTTYDVQHGKIGATDSRTSAGVFIGGDYASNHNVSGAMSVYAAPGGPGTAGVDPTPVLDSHGTQVNWDVEFGCQSCHSPHGQGGNARLLNPDVNGYAWANKQTGRALNKVDDVTYTSDWNGDGVADTWIQGYPYTSSVYDGGVKKTVTIDNTAGYTQVIFSAAPAGAVTADFFPGVAVKMTVANYLAANETVTHVSGLNTFCGACHADYNTESHKVNGKSSGSGADLTGTYTEAYRHQVGYAYGGASKLAAKNMKVEAGNIVTCETCHVAHGTDAQYWQDTLAAASIPDADLKELVGSSALKRLPNMGVCEACHGKGTGNQGYGQVGAAPDALNSPNFNLGTGILDYTGMSSATLDGKSYFGLFIQADGTGFFKNQEYVGAEACKSCHANYYEGWKDQGHSKSIQTADEAGLAQEFAVGDQPVTHYITYAADPSVKWPYTIDPVAKTLSYPYYANLANAIAKDANGNFAPIVMGTTTISISDIKKVWMEHYILIDGDKRAAMYDQLAPVGQRLEPYIGYKTVFPGAPTTVTYYSGDPAQTTGCLSCHSPKSNGALGTPDMTIGCEACHGPAGNHVKAPSAYNILNPANPINGLSATQQTNLCLTCHSGKHNTTEIKGTAHEANDDNGYTCTSCHDVHNTIKDGNHSNLRMPETKLCATCHEQYAPSGYDIHEVPKAVD